MHEELILWHLGNMTFHGKTLIMTWFVMVLILIFCFMGVRRLTSDKPGKMQNVLEWIMDLVRGLISDSMDYQKGRSLLNYLVTLILFLLFSNLIGLVPNFTFNLFEHLNIEAAHLNKIFEGPTLQSPTADVNTTIALALLTITIVVIYGIKHKGLHYFHHFIEPFVFFLPINILDFVAKPLTLAFRLFGNIFAGEVLIKVILMLPGIWVFAGVLPDAAWLGFSIFIGVIQSYVFTLLTTAYVSQAISESH
ncbi:MAG TPA: F0F1 ATP synthase subunit A [Desulfitobacteriaceae bacterium]|jgi:F-type H+-transporting ATPase subunit a|nr:F0F1 ATP synthase subunit A [Desulfitobacteriaceae bacterium]